ncbi:MAG: A/G-specific adenine glycosylase [Candidatus Omnitrophica bacterium]|nr:A/G-specific adenine glycosylase [Candidatus Omnitrophota bacterium]
MNVNVSRFRRKLTQWFSKHQRALPWRIHGNPYRIFVVETMLQQTQIKTVIPYYQRWLKKFPNVNVLAEAPLDHVLKLWEGLGYYTRARNLHKAAQIIAERFDGKIPNDPEILRSLPGIGRYTAGAIASIAFQKPVPLVDGNVARVFSRIFCLRKDIAKPKTQKILYELAEKLVPEKNPGIFNQALMELGSLVCIPETPKCSVCPVQSLCLAFQKGDPSKLPIKSGGVQVKKIEMVVGILEKDGRLLVRRRPERGIWGGLWEIPGTVRAKNETLEEALKLEFKETLDLSIQIHKKERPIKHHFTHRDATIYPFHLKIASNGLKQRSQKVRWATPKTLNQLSFPVPHQKILKTICTLS